MNDESKLKELVSYDGSDSVVHFTDYLAAHADAEKNIQRFKSGFDFFEEKCGLASGEVVVVTGPTKAGKTLFAESWCRSIAQNDSAAQMLFFSFEVPASVMLKKYQGEPAAPLYVPRELRTMDFPWLKNRCLEGKLKHGVSIVLIDHLHFLVDMATKQNMSLNIGGFMRRLKQEIAIGLNLAVILIAHQGQPKEGQEASVMNIRDSSFVAQEADAVVIVQRRENYKPEEFPKLHAKYGGERIARLFPENASDEDRYSTGLAVIKIACHRRTGVMDAKKLFQKRGWFLEEV